MPLWLACFSGFVSLWLVLVSPGPACARDFGGPIRVGAKGLDISHLGRCIRMAGPRLLGLCAIGAAQQPDSRDV